MESPHLWTRSLYYGFSGQKTLSEALSSRYLLGLGVSRRPPGGAVASAQVCEAHRNHARLPGRHGRGSIMPCADCATSRVFAALGSQDAGVGCERSDGAHSYNPRPNTLPRLES